MVPRNIGGFLWFPLKFPLNHSIIPSFSQATGHSVTSAQTFAATMPPLKRPAAAMASGGSQYRVVA